MKRSPRKKKATASLRKGAKKSAAKRTTWRNRQLTPTPERYKEIQQALAAKGYEVHYQENVGGHDYLSWRGSLADGLIALMGERR